MFANCSILLICKGQICLKWTGSSIFAYLIEHFDHIKAKDLIYIWYISFVPDCFVPSCLHPVCLGDSLVMV